MPPPRGQNTFVTIPNPLGVQGLLTRRASGIALPALNMMTTKQAQQSYRERTRQPRMTRAEQRHFELEEQARIRKELNKKKAAGKARAAREKKRDRERAEADQRRRRGLPLVHVTSSQDTIARFVRGGGTVMKRERGLASVGKNKVVGEEEEAEEKESQGKERPMAKRHKTNGDDQLAGPIWTAMQLVRNESDDQSRRRSLGLEDPRMEAMVKHQLFSDQTHDSWRSSFVAPRTVLETATSDAGARQIAARSCKASVLGGIVGNASTEAPQEKVLARKPLQQVSARLTQGKSAPFKQKPDRSSVASRLGENPRFLPRHLHTPAATKLADGAAAGASADLPPPTSTQLFVMLHIDDDDMFPSPSQDDLEVRNEKQKPKVAPVMPIMETPALPSPQKLQPPQDTTQWSTSRPSVRQAGRFALPQAASARSAGYSPAHYSALPLSTQDFVLSSQDVRDLQVLIDTPSKMVDADHSKTHRREQPYSRAQYDPSRRDVLRHHRSPPNNSAVAPPPPPQLSSLSRCQEPDATTPAPQPIHRSSVTCDRSSELVFDDLDDELLRSLGAVWDGVVGSREVEDQSRSRVLGLYSNSTGRKCETRAGLDGCYCPLGQAIATTRAATETESQ